MSDQEILEMFACADLDGDGRISYDEFLVMITPQHTACPALPLPSTGPVEEEPLLSPVTSPGHSASPTPPSPAPGEVPVATLVTTA